MIRSLLKQNENVKKKKRIKKSNVPTTSKYKLFFNRLILFIKICV